MIPVSRYGNKAGMRDASLSKNLVNWRDRTNFTLITSSVDAFAVICSGEE
ncbi:hypothetical protein [Coleofasciculus sp. F4-SAH-05]